MIKFKAPSGANVEIAIVEIGISWRLNKVVMAALGAGGFSKIFNAIPKEKNIDVMQVLEASPIIDALISVLTSEDVEEYVWQVLERCLYNGQKITRETFDPEKNRGDFIIVASRALWENVRPFWLPLISQFSETKKAI